MLIKTQIPVVCNANEKHVFRIFRPLITGADRFITSRHVSNIVIWKMGIHYVKNVIDNFSSGLINNGEIGRKHKLIRESFFRGGLRAGTNA